MATQSVGKAAARINFRKGGKQVYLPNHVITFIRPKPKQPPNLATFVVPLTFNKLDLRDYLFNAYNVSVTGVRSFINEQKPERKNMRGPWYRPRSQKMMIAELVNPFVWPEPPAKDAESRSDFDYEMYLRGEKERSRMIQRQKDQVKSVVRMRDMEAIPKDTRLLQEQAAELVNSRAEWVGKALLDEGEGQWVEVEEDMAVPEKEGAVYVESAGELGTKDSEARSSSLNDKDHDVVVEDQQQILKK